MVSPGWVQTVKRKTNCLCMWMQELYILVRYSNLGPLLSEKQTWCCKHCLKLVGTSELKYLIIIIHNKYFHRVFVSPSYSSSSLSYCFLESSTNLFTHAFGWNMKRYFKTLQNYLGSSQTPMPGQPSQVCHNSNLTTYPRNLGASHVVTVKEILMLTVSTARHDSALARKTAEV